MMRLFLLLACLAVLFCGVVQASIMNLTSLVTPGMSVHSEMKFLVKVERSDQFFWFEVKIEEPEGSTWGYLWIHGEDAFSHWLDSECSLRLYPAKVGGALIFSFGLSEAKLTNSFFTFRKTDTRLVREFQFDLKAFALDQCY